MTTTATNANQKKQTNANPEFAIGHIYIKDSSFELVTPMHKIEKWEPNAEISRKHAFVKKESDEYEVTLTVSIKVSANEQKAFLIEIQQSGAFLMKNFTQEQIEHLMESYCPNILLPYARQAISAQIIQGGFPPLFLPPVDFESEYMQKKEK